MAHRRCPGSKSNPKVHWVGAVLELHRMKGQCNTTKHQQNNSETQTRCRQNADERKRKATRTTYIVAIVWQIGPRLAIPVMKHSLQHSLLYVHSLLQEAENKSDNEARLSASSSGPAEQAQPKRIQREAPEVPGSVAPPLDEDGGLFEAL